MAMPAPETPKSFDAASADAPGRLEEIRRSSLFRYLAVAICGIGLATAGSTLIRLSQGWRQLPPATSTSDASSSAPAVDAPPTNPISAPELTETREPSRGPALAEPVPSVPAPGDPEIKLADKQPAQAAPEPIAPIGETSVSGQPAAEAPPQIAQAPATAGPTEPSTAPSAPASAPIAENSSPDDHPGAASEIASTPSPAPVAPASPEVAQAPEAVPPTAPPASPAPTAPARSTEPNRSVGPSKQGVETPAREKRPIQPRRSRYAAPARFEPSGHLREIAAPAGSAPGVRAYSFAANGGRMTGAYGAPVQIIRVR